MVVDMKVPFAAGLKAHDRSVFAVVSTMGPDNSDVVEAVVVRIIPQHFTHLLAAAFFALFSRTDIYDFGRRMFFFAHFKTRRVVKSTDNFGHALKNSVPQNSGPGQRRA